MAMEEGKWSYDINKNYIPCNAMIINMIVTENLHVVNFKTRKISRGMRKLIQTPTLIKNSKKNYIPCNILNLNCFLCL